MAIRENSPTKAKIIAKILFFIGNLLCDGCFVDKCSGFVGVFDDVSDKSTDDTRQPDDGQTDKGIN